MARVLELGRMGEHGYKVLEQVHGVQTGSTIEPGVVFELHRRTQREVAASARRIAVANGIPDQSPPPAPRGPLGRTA